MKKITEFNQFKDGGYYYVTSIQYNYSKISQAKRISDNRLFLKIDGEDLSVWASDFYGKDALRYTFIEVNQIDNPEYFL